jgi:hypothetical protein
VGISSQDLEKMSCRGLLQKPWDFQEEEMVVELLLESLPNKFLKMLSLVSGVKKNCDKCIPLKIKALVLRTKRTPT